MKYQISYNHTSPEFASSYRESRRAVRREAKIRCMIGMKVRLRSVKCDDGEYLYLSTADLRRDGDGSRAFAIISEAGGAR
jgi:hypothetical protein